MAAKNTSNEAEQTVIKETTETNALYEEIKAKLLDDAKAEAEKIIADAKAEAKAEAEKVLSEASKTEKPYQETPEEIAKANEKVKIRLFKDKDKYNMDVLVILNGESWLIKRGVEVEVPRKVANVIACSDAQTSLAADVIEAYKEDYEKKKDQLV